MPISYNKLFHILLDRNIKKGELQIMADITAPIMSRLAKGETIKSDTIEKICQALDCQPNDIMEYINPTVSDEIIDKMYERYETFADLISRDEFKKILIKCTKVKKETTIIDQDKLIKYIKYLWNKKYNELEKNKIDITSTKINTEDLEKW